MRAVTMIAVEAEIKNRWSVRTLATADDAVKLPVTRNPLDKKPFIPGSSIAGSLRRHLGDTAEDWLGREPGAFEESRKNDVRLASRLASRLALLGSVIDADTHHGGSTGIDPRRGTADGRTLREHEWAVGAALTMAFQHDGEANPALVDHLLSWRPYIGAGRSSGMGQTVITRVHTLTLDLDKAPDLRFWLGADRAQWFKTPADRNVGVYTSKPRKADKSEAPDPSDWTTIGFIVKEPLCVGGDKRSEGTTQVLDPLRLTADGAPLVPGASWRGIFRHRIHTILGAVGASDEECTTVLEGLFGSTKRGRGPLWFADSTLSNSCVTRTHVAIDRFTGGALDSLLFRVKAVKPGTHVDLSYRWEHGKMPGALDNLLQHVARDLHDGLATVGGMGTRGYGWVQLPDDRIPRPSPVVIEDLIAATSGLDPDSSRVEEGSAE